MFITMGISFACTCCTVSVHGVKEMGAPFLVVSYDETGFEILYVNLIVSGDLTPFLQPGLIERKINKRVMLRSLPNEELNF